MKFGQMSFKGISSQADYLQLDICGHTPEEAVERYLGYKTNIPVILHGDWEKKGYSENNLKVRVPEYIETVFKIKEHTQVIGITIHPLHRKKMPMDEMLSLCKTIELETQTHVFLENRSNKRIWLSRPDEIVAFSKDNLMTIDIPQLYIASNFDFKAFCDVLEALHWDNVRELHLGNLRRSEGRTFVARKVQDGEMNFDKLSRYLSRCSYTTLEILGGINVFNEQASLLKAVIE